MRMIWNRTPISEPVTSTLSIIFSIGTLLFVLLAVLLLRIQAAHLDSLQSENISACLRIGGAFPLQLHNHTDSDWCLCVVAFCITASVDSFKKLLHRQAGTEWYWKISGMKPIPYKTAVFTDLQSRSRKNRLNSGPQYQMEKGSLHINSMKLRWEISR